MCKYCEGKSNGDYFTMKSRKINIENNQTIRDYVQKIEIKTTSELEHNVSMNFKEGVLESKVSLFQSKERLSKFTVKMNYCPMCGRKLNTD